MADMEVSKQGVKTSFRRFVSDVATGYFAYAFAFCFVYSNRFEPKIHGLLFIIEHTDPVWLAAIGLLAIFLAQPIGLIINNFVWLILHWPCEKMFELSFRHNLLWFINYLNRMYCFSESVRVFGLCKGNFQKRLRTIVTVFNAYRPSIGTSVEYMGGIGIFFRNLASLSFCWAIASLWINEKTCCGCSAILWGCLSCVLFLMSHFAFYRQALCTFSYALAFLWGHELRENEKLPNESTSENDFIANINKFLLTN